MSVGHEGEEPIDDALLREAAARALTCVMCGDTDPGAEGIAGAVLVSHLAAELLAAREQLRLADALAEAAELHGAGRLDDLIDAYRAARGAR